MLPNGGTISYLTGRGGRATPALPDLESTSHPHQNWMGVTPPPEEWTTLGQVMLRRARLLRFPVGGLSC